MRESFGLSRDGEEGGTEPTLRLSRRYVLGRTGPSAGSEVVGSGAGEAGAGLHTPTRVRVSVRGHRGASTGQREVSLDRHRWGNTLTNAGFSITLFTPTLRGCLRLLPQMGLILICVKSMQTGPSPLTVLSSRPVPAR